MNMNETEIGDMKMKRSLNLTDKTYGIHLNIIMGLDTSIGTVVKYT
jgi:hypothetical protein